MPTVHYVQPDGSETVLEVPEHESVMRAAIVAGVPGIVAECGGQAMCATCHVYVRDGDALELPEMGEDEDEMLDCTASERTARSRLSCQLKNLDGIELTVEVPERQL